MIQNLNNPQEVNTVKDENNIERDINAYSTMISIETITSNIIYNFEKSRSIEILSENSDLDNFKIMTNGMSNLINLNHNNTEHYKNGKIIKIQIFLNNMH